MILMVEALDQEKGGQRQVVVIDVAVVVIDVALSERQKPTWPAEASAVGQRRRGGGWTESPAECQRFPTETLTSFEKRGSFRIGR